jgi:hypothetical protein
MLYPSNYGVDPAFPQAADFAVVQKDADSGQGVICYRSFKRGDTIAKMAGEVIDTIRQHTLQIVPGKHLYDPYFSGYFLHSCAPNISLNMDTMTVTALDDIDANSFLYMDYAETEDYLFKQFPCSCGSFNCRGWISGKKDIPESLQVSPLHRAAG